MEEGTLKDLFARNSLPEDLYWRYSTDPRVQLMQNQGALGGKIPLGISFIARQLREERAKDKDGPVLDELASLVIETHRRFIEASRAAHEALLDLHEALDRSRDELARYREEFAANTVHLPDGTPVYYNTATGGFERRDAQGTWHALEDEADIRAALTAAAEYGGLASTKQGRQALDAWEAQVAAGYDFHETQENRLAEIDEAVAAGTMSAEEGTEAKRAVTDDIKDFTNEVRKRRIDAQTTHLPATVRIQTQFHAQETKNLSEGSGGQKPTEELDDIFGGAATAGTPNENGYTDDRNPVRPQMTGNPQQDWSV